MKCCVESCKNQIKFKFPSNKATRQKWLEAIRRPCLKITPKYGLCIDHFDPKSIIKESIHYGYKTSKDILKRGTVPTIFPWNNERLIKSESDSSSLSERYLKKKFNSENQEIFNTKNRNVSSVSLKNEKNNCIDSDHNYHLNIENEENDEMDIDHNYHLNIQNEKNNYVVRDHNYHIKIENEKNPHIDSAQNNFVNIECPLLSCLDKEVQATARYQDKEVQVNFEYYLNFIRNEKDLNIMTGLPTFEHLYALENIVRIVNSKITFSFKSLSKLSIKDRIVLTFIRLKQNVSYGQLQVMFKVYSEENCRKIFLTMIEILSTGLKSFIHLPQKNEILPNIPKSFICFANVRAIIDVLEINISSPKNSCCQLASYSNYEQGHTICFLIAVTPSGLISFVSHAFLGKSSYKAIFEESNLIKLLNKGDGLVINKEFSIDEICVKHEVQLIRPLLLRNKKISKEEAMLNAKIVRAGVHIEKSIQRIKVFKILSAEVPAYLFPKIEQIFTIICAIVNLSSPILK